MYSSFNSPIYLDNILDTFLGDIEGFGNMKKKFEFPSYPVNIFIGEDDSLVFEVAASGCTKENINVEAKNNILTIRVEPNKEEDAKKDYICNKLVKRATHLEYKINDKYNLKKTGVKLNNGILEITIPVNEDAKPERITFDIS